jgi:hypothetical protein
MKKLASRKLWAAVIGAVINIIGDHFGLSPEARLSVTGIVGTYVLGQGLADAGAGKSQTTEQ